MKRSIFLPLLFLTTTCYAQPQLEYEAYQCEDQESTITVTNISNFALPVKYAINGSKFQKNNTFKGLPFGDHILTVKDAENLEHNFDILLPEREALNFKVKSEYMDCDEKSNLYISDITGGTSPYHLFVNDIEVSSAIIEVETNKNSIVLSDKYGCSVKKIEWIPSKCFKPYNIITPNGDGFNDDWEIEQLNNFPDAHLTLYNKWGQELFQLKSSDTPWNGSDLPMATYYYVIQLDGKEDNKNIITGDLTILR